MKRNALMIASMAAILALIAYMALDLYQASRQEVIAQFQEQQRLIARHVANQIEKHLGRDGREIQVLVAHRAVQCHDLGQIAQEVQVALEASGRKHHENVFVYNEQGVIIQSSEERAIGLDHSRRDFFLWARVPENRGKLLVCRGGTQNGTAPTAALGSCFLLATPIYRESEDLTGKELTGEFAGVAAMEVNLGEFLADQLSHASRMGRSLQIWLIAKDGTLLYHPEHPEIVSRNVQSPDSSCAACHGSFEHVKDALRVGEGTTHYQVKDRPARLAAFAPIRYQNVSWLAVVSAPYDLATAFVRYSGRKILILLCLVALAVAAGSNVLYRSYRLRLSAEEQGRQWQEKQVLHEQIRVSEERHRTLVENARDSIFSLAADGTILSLNPAFETITGWRQRRLARQTI
jgi:PAS domain-containing protein